MITEILQKHIPSKTYVDYLNDIGHTFTDFETAAILYHAIPYVQQRFDVLGQLAEETDDDVLKLQIEEKAALEKEKINLLTASSAEAIFVVEYYDEEYREYEVAGYAASFEVAWEIGMKTGSEFLINRHALCLNALDEASSEPLYGSAYFNPYIGKAKGWEITEDNIQEVMQENIVDPITKDLTPYNRSFGSFTYDNKGRLLNYWVDEYWLRDLFGGTLKEKAKNIMENQYSDKLFYNAFVSMPFPFELGDYVKYVDGYNGEYANSGDTLIGIVSVSRKNYEEFLERAKTIYVDFSDAQVTTTFIKESGEITHHHVSPIFLEKAEVDEEAEWFDLAQHTRWMIMGEGALDFFTYAYDKYKDKVKQTKNGEG